MTTLTKRPNGESLRARHPMSPQGSEYGSSILDPLADQMPSMRRIARALLGNGGQLDAWDGGSFPQIELYEKDGNYVVEARVPGFKRDEIEIDCSDNAITISGSSQRQAVEDQLKGRVYYSEFQRRDFSRTVTLSVEIDPERVNAKLQDGLLTITLPMVGSSTLKRVPITV